MADGNPSPWPQTADGRTDWETVFEDPMSGLIALISQARSPATLRQSTIVVIESIYARDGAPPEIAAFGSELERMLPDDLPDAALPKVADAVIEVLREIKVERIRREEDAVGLDDMDMDFGDFDDEDDDTAKKKKKKKKGGWFSRNKKPKKAKKPAPARKGGKKGKSSKHLVVFGLLALLLVTIGGGGAYYLFFMEHGLKPGEKTQQLIEEMKLAAEGRGPERHVFGWELTAETRGDLTGVTAVGVPADACASVSWYFVNRGNVLINDRLPEKVAPSVLKNFCEEKGQLAKIMWVFKAKPGAGEEATPSEAQSTTQE